MASSKAVILGDQTILEAVVDILRDEGNRAMSPSEIANVGVTYGYLQVPRGRTKSYLNQLIQSQLYNNFAYARKKFVTRTSPGKYKARKAKVFAD